MRIGVIFGGQSREREISFAGGRTVYDNLNKSTFTPVPIFVDSLGHFILLDWQYLYKGTIRDFYPVAEYLPESPHFFQIYAESLTQEPERIEKSIQKIGRKIAPEELPQLIDFAFLTLHGSFGEDGNIQGLLEWYKIPYSGAGILPSSIGIDKQVQKAILKDTGFFTPENISIKREEWRAHPQAVLEKIRRQFTFPVVIKAPHQGSSIGVSIIKNEKDLADGIHQSFFIQQIELEKWKTLTDNEKRNFLIKFTDIREGLGFPVILDDRWIYHPEALWKALDTLEADFVRVEVPDGESEILVEAFVEGREFSCIVIENEDGTPLALPPTEIRKSGQLFDYRAKYLPGISRKITPINLPDEEIRKIRHACENLFRKLHSQVYARIDGFYTKDGQVVLNDPNTTSGMLPSSFFFHQAAEIGLNPSQFLTYIIETSLKARIRSGKNIWHTRRLLDSLNQSLKEAASHQQDKIRVGVIMGGFSSERHISVESGRNIYEKLASSDKYLPIPIFLTANDQPDGTPGDEHLLYQLPVNIMLKDNADDIREKVLHPQSSVEHPVILQINGEARKITSKYTFGSATKLEKLTYRSLSEKIDFAFIALHGRPGEDGAIQAFLEQYEIPYNGSGIESSGITINKYETNEILKKKGILVADHALVHQSRFMEDPVKEVENIEHEFSYPIIAKPADDGCSSAVKKIKSREEFRAFAAMMFRDTPEFPEGPRQILKLKNSEEFPQKDSFLVEDLIVANGAQRFMEITGGIITRFDDSGNLLYEVFEPSETLASGEVLSLEEKFLAGEGQNITPARFGNTEKEYRRVAREVKRVLEETARAVGIEGYCRIDAFVRIYPDKVETVIIEINSLPGMTPATAIFHQSALNGIKPYELIDRIISYGFERKKRSAFSGTKLP